MTEQLKPCPFCGGAASVDTRSNSTAIRCANDQCITGDPAPFNDFTHRTDAVQAWNTRHDPGQAWLDARDAEFDDRWNARMNP